jgi:hypothetical protein
MRLRFRIAAWFALLLAACGPEIYALNYTSFVDPAYRTRPLAARSVLVMAPTLGLARRAEAERAMANVLRESGLVAVSGLDVFPPTRGTPTNDEVLIELRRRGLDGAVLLWTTYERVVITRGTRTVTETELQTIVVDGRATQVRVERRREVPYVDKTPTAQYRSSFLIPGGPTIWTAEATFRGPTFEAIAADAGTGAIAKLQQDRVIAAPVPRGVAPPPGAAGAGVGGAGAGGGLVLPGFN